MPQTTQTTQTNYKGLLFCGQQLLLIQQDGRYHLPILNGEHHWLCETTHSHHIGVYHDYQCYAAQTQTPYQLNEQSIWVPLKKAFEHLGLDWFPIAARAYQIIQWDQNHYYCGRCGQTTEKKPTAFERHCISCQLYFYPRISPSIIVMIRKGKQILMARKAEFPANVHALIAGFVEPGESLEDTVHREVKEEVGITVKNIRYFGSQPWPFPDSLMLAFTADYEAGEITLPDGELEAAGWYNADNLPGSPSSSISIARQLIESFVQE